MLLRIGRASLWALVGYLGAAFVTYWLVMWLSSNTYDRQMEAGMTAVFVAGPIFAVIAFLVGVFRRD